MSTAYGAAGRCQRGQGRGLVVVDRRGNGDDEQVAAGQRLRVAGELELVGGLQFVGRELQSVVMVLVQLGNALRVDVEADRGIAASEGGCQRQPHVEKPDHGEHGRAYWREGVCQYMSIYVCDGYVKKKQHR